MSFRACLQTTIRRSRHSRQTLGIKMTKLAEVVTESCPDPRIRYAVLGDADPLEVFQHLRSVSGIWDDHFRLREATCAGLHFVPEGGG